MFSLIRFSSAAAMTLLVSLPGFARTNPACPPLFNAKLSECRLTQINEAAEDELKLSAVRFQRLISQLNLLDYNGLHRVNFNSESCSYGYLNDSTGSYITVFDKSAKPEVLRLTLPIRTSEKLNLALNSDVLISSNSEAELDPVGAGRANFRVSDRRSGRSVEIGSCHISIDVPTQSR